MLKKGITLLFFTLSLIFSLVTLPNSAAIGAASFSRNATASVSKDNQAILKLDGFDLSQIYSVDKNYSKVGSITNNSNQILILTISITPDLTNINNKNYHMGIKIGNASCMFMKNSDSTQQITQTIMPGETLDVQIYLSKNQSDYVTTSFRINAVDTAGTFSMSLDDTQNTPRRMIIY
ncbi:MAG TPA: hypothetical protein VN258_17350 [Mobilitalea sp.]|nr:hypothetical protein [Mobilitalea sp.]